MIHQHGAALISIFESLKTLAPLLSSTQRTDDGDGDDCLADECRRDAEVICSPLRCVVLYAGVEEQRHVTVRRTRSGHGQHSGRSVGLGQRVLDLT